jgi:hypothetical protein
MTIMKRVLAAALGFIALSASAQDCTLILPKHLLTAAGLATPFQLTSADPANPCNELDPNHSAFVQAAIIDPETGAISVYSPLVIDAGTAPAVPPVVPVLPPNAVIALWFGFNGNNLKLSAPAGGEAEDDREFLDRHRCVNGLRGSLFSQFSYCNAVAFFHEANRAIQSHKIVVPPLGTGKDGQVCPSVRSFTVVDQDQSDNVQTLYLATPSGQVAQWTHANIAMFPTAVKFGNPSDNKLVTGLLDPALGCTPWTAPDLADPGHSVPALALNELQAAAFQAPPVALVPLNDPMTTIDGKYSSQKTELYRAGVNQPLEASADPVHYCSHLRAIHPVRLEMDKALLAVAASPFPNMANSLFTFMAQRYVASYGLLNCEVLLNLPVNETLTMDAAGVVTDAVYTP